MKGPRFDGARELDRWLRERDTTVPHFCEEHSVDRFHIDRLLRGTVKRCPPADIVEDIQRATEGRVLPSMWREETLRDDVDGEVPSAAESGAELDDVDEAPPSPTAKVG